MNYVVLPCIPRTFMQPVWPPDGWVALPKLRKNGVVKRMKTCGMGSWVEREVGSVFDARHFRVELFQ